MSCLVNRRLSLNVYVVWWLSLCRRLCNCVLVAVSVVDVCVVTLAGLVVVRLFVVGGCVIVCRCAAVGRLSVLA